MKTNRSITTLILITGVIVAIGLGCGNRTGTNSTTDAPTNSSTTSSSPATTPKNIAGDYDATGTNVNGGGTYKASLVVTPRDDVYQFSWNSGGKAYDGVGVLTDNTVAVSYTDGANGKGCGVVLYKIGSDGSLDGRSGYWGVNSAEVEKATRTGGSGLEGSYNITGTNTGGKDYKGTLEVKKDGEGFTFAWNAGSAFEGFGIKIGEKVAVGFGGKQCAFVAYEVKSDGTLDGKWGGQGARSFGTEIAKKK